MQKRLKRHCTVFLFIFLIALSFNLFLTPYNFAASGVSGLAIIINRLTGINESLFIFIINCILVLVSFNYLGFKKTEHSIIGSFLLPILIYFTEPVTRYVSFSGLDPLFIAILGGAITGLGSGLVYQNDYTTGGTDILDQLMEKYMKIPMNKCILYIDGVIVILNLIVFGFATMLYSLVVLYLISEISNRTMLKINRNELLFIESKKANKIKEFLTTEYNYDVTLLNATGSFTKKRKKTLLCAIKKKDYYGIKEGIVMIDPRAFITTLITYEQKNGNQTLRKELENVNTLL